MAPSRVSGESSERNSMAAFPEAIATAFPSATEAAAETLRGGGNAVDAAVAAAWALSVCEPSASGLGGQTVMLIRFPDGRATVIDGHSRAPAAASPELISREQQRAGRRATTIPMTPATLQYAHARYGRVPWHHTLEPAIRIAEMGYHITALQHRQAVWVLHRLDASAAELFLARGNPPPTGHLLRQPSLAATLRRIAALSTDDFYRGGIARAIVADMARHDGLLAVGDLASCGPPRECNPISACYRGRRILTVPRPGGGPQLLLALRMIEQLLPGAAAADSWRATIALVTAAVFRWREQSGSDPDNSPSAVMPIHDEESCIHAMIAALRDGGPAMPFGHGPAEEQGDTTHLSVSDRYGNVVALTQSIQSLFGAKTAHPDLGFLYNNYLHTCPRRPHAYQLGPACRPRSNASPTLVLRGTAETGPPLLALGAAGSRRITSAILQVIGGVIDRGLDVASAVAAPRVHGLTNGKVWLEAPAVTKPLLRRIQAQGSRPIVKSTHSYGMAAVQALHFLPEGDVRGAADPRRDGTAVVLSQPKQPGSVT